MTESATQDTGVQKSKRDKDFEELIASRAEERKAEGTELPPVFDAAMEAKKDEPVEEPENVLEPKAKPNMIIMVDDEGNKYEVPTTAKFKLKIDGSEVEETFDRVTRGYQKGAAADKRLEQATIKIRELDAKERTLNARGYALTQQEQAAKQQLQKLEQQHDSGKLSTDAYKEKAQQLVSALLDDDDPVEKVAKILPSLVPQQQAPQVDLDRMRTDIRSMVRADIELDDAKSRFHRDYEDLANDVDLYNMVNEKTKVLVRTKPTSKPWEIIQEAAEGVREWVKKLSPNEVEPTSTKPKPKPSPKPASGRASVGEDKKPPTREDILNEMRKARGQAPFTSGLPT